MAPAPKANAMRPIASLAAVVLLAAVSSDGLACRTLPPMPAPVYSELVKSSDLVAVVRVQRIRPLSQEQKAEMDRLFTDPPLDTPFRFPTTSAEFSTIRVLKGKLPAQSRLQNGATSCDVVLSENNDYLIFANLADAHGDEIVPLYGTFRLDESQYSLIALAEVESALTPSNRTQP
jgi:hypothetical protein